MISATRNRIIISQESREKTTASGLIIDIHSGVELDRGVVQSVGTGVEGIAVGDTVIISHLGTNVGENLMSVAADHVVAVVE
jgi:co-chaperonin GroES (HSP10)